METTFLSIGLVHRYEDEKSEYLVTRKKQSEMWSPIVGERLEKESFRDTIVREIGWRLDLDRSKDFVVSNMAASSQEYVEETDDGIHHYAVAFYRAKLFSKNARNRIRNDSSNQWVSPTELCAGEMKDASKIDPIVVQWINRWSVLNPWE